MGSWSHGIMGGDTPYDVRGDFEDRFGMDDEEMRADLVADGDPDPGAPRKPTAEEGLAFMREMAGMGDSEEKVVVGYLLLTRAAPLAAETRALILEGIEGEIADADRWSRPEERIQVMNDFRKIVDAYPPEGAEVELPETPGLFETLAEHLTT